MSEYQVAGASNRRWRCPFRCRERKAPWGHAPLRGSRRESAVFAHQSQNNKTQL
jgi:hypothetical protein